MYPTKRNQVANVDVVGRNHHHLCLLFGDTNRNTKTKALRLLDLPGYRWGTSIITRDLDDFPADPST